MTTTAQPTAEMFTGNPRSNEIRSISLKLTEKLEGTLGGGLSARQKTDILNLVGKLQAMSITANMHVGEPQEIFSDPVIMAEYVAGQILTSVKSDNGNDVFIDFLVMRSVLNCVYRFLAAD